jgi:hypothetical protein
MNLNDSVFVVLTDAGLDMYNKAHTCIPNHTPRTERHLTIQLWSLMEIFGPHIHMTMSHMPFVDNEILPCKH